MDMRKYSGAIFIKVADVRNGALQMQIAAVKEGKYGRPDLVFESGEILSLNASNNRILMSAYGSNSDDWIGKKIDLTLGQLLFEEVARRRDRQADRRTDQSLAEDSGSAKKARRHGRCDPLLRNVGYGESRLRQLDRKSPRRADRKGDRTAQNRKQAPQAGQRACRALPEVRR